MHLASKSFSESGQESGRLVAEQNKRAFSLDRHEWEDFAVCIWYSSTTDSMSGGVPIGSHPVQRATSHSVLAELEAARYP